MSGPDARKSGTFLIGGDLKVHRLGFGAMRITGKGIWGEPPDHEQAVRTLESLENLASTLSIRQILTARLSRKT